MSDRKAREAPPLPCGETSKMVTVTPPLRCFLPAGHPARHRARFGSTFIEWGGERPAMTLN